MRLIINISLLLSALVLYQGCGRMASKETRVQDPIEIMESIEVDSVPADFPVSFAAISRDQRQYLAYYNGDRYLTVAARDLSENQWQYKVLPTRVGWDSHNSITMTMDRNECIHLSGNMHNDTLLYFKSKYPRDIESLERLFPLVSVEDESSCTYPSFIKDAEEKLYFSYRIGGSGNGVTILNRYNEVTESFERLSTEPLFDGKGQMSAYKSGPALGPDGLFHVIWLWRDTPACETNHDLSYAQSKDLIHWQSLGDEISRVPIHPGEDLFTVDPVPPGGGAINGNFKLFFDPDNQPLIAYLKYDDAGYSQVYLASVNEGRWESRKISNWNYRWEFSGPGSIDFEIKINKARQEATGDVLISFDHTKEGPGVLVVNGKTHELIEVRSNDPMAIPAYPESLSKVTMDEEGVRVRWKQLSSAEDDQEFYYVLRWETMGKRRYYKAPERPVQASSLVLYKLSKSKK